MRWFVVVLFFAQSIQNIAAAKILALCAVASPSHSLWCYHYMAVLAERGHQITVLGLDKPKIKISNLTTFISTDAYQMLAKEMDISEWTVNDKSKIRAMYPAFTKWNEVVTNATMHSQVVKDLIHRNKNNTKPYDLIIHDSGCCDALLGLVPLFGNPPLLLATTYGSPQWMNFRAGNILNPAFVPSMINGGDQFMTFYERCINTFYFVFMELVNLLVMEPYQDKIMREVLGNDLPHVRDIAKRANIIIVNHHFAINGPRPMLPGVIGISGLHVTDPKPLPQDIKTFLDDAKDGAILLSFGTNINSAWFPSNFEELILRALEQTPQRVLWKWDKTLPKLPSNVKVSNWLPQGDILVHPNVKLFVSHCGLLSIQEALYRKVLLLALPVFLDQMDNAAMMVRFNLTIKLNVYELTSEKLRDGIKEVLTNPKFKRNMERLGELMADTPLTAKQSAVYWTEYAIRHQGAAHLHAASSDLSWPQLLLLDVIGFILALILTTIWILKYLFSAMKNVLLRGLTKNKRD